MTRGIPWSLTMLTVVTGMVDAVSFLRLGRVFVANMTGNVVFLGFSASGYKGFSAVGSLVAIVSFLCGALIGGRIVRYARDHTRLLVHAMAVKLTLAIVALIIAALVAVQIDSLAAYCIIAVLAMAMGIQNAAARNINAPDFTTTVLTFTLTGIASDFAAGSDPKVVRRSISVLSMFAGAVIGAMLILHGGIVPALVVICLTFALTSVVTIVTAPT